ncbi:MAG: peptide deformylase [Heliobacteriaceae bacterium]|nr:peptide deformylase [Heliobacteriaceae bacterium]MDD4586980.1 peptide deformylase [Heliobacteriaceae bacterium]
MAIYEILKIGHPVLREKARVVTKFKTNLGRLLDDMYETMVAAPGVGLAAPQIGIAKQVVVIDIGEGRLELVNPEIIQACGHQDGLEGCLSVPGVEREVRRFDSVRVKAQDRHGQEFTFEATGFLARALQHEIDHLAGILFVDRANREGFREG